LPPAVGLLIAVTRGQSVKYLHHRHQRDQSCEALGSELGQDNNIFEQNIALLQSATDYDQQYLAKNPNKYCASRR